MDLLDRRTVGSVYVLEKGDVQLTVGEYNILEYLILNRGRTVNYAEISNEVWIKHGHVGALEIDNTVRELRKKIEENSWKPKRILRRFGKGYTVPVKGQSVINDEGSPVLTSVKMGAVDFRSYLGKAVGIAIVAVALVLFYMILSLGSYR